MSQTLALSPNHPEVGGLITAELESLGTVSIDAPSDRTTASSKVGPRQRILERGEILGAIACEVPFQAVIDPHSMTLQSSPVVVAWPYSDTGTGPQPFVALYPSGAIRSVSAVLREGLVEFPLPMELIDPDSDPVEGRPFRFELFQFAPHPRDRVIPSSPASQTPAFEESVASVPAKKKRKRKTPSSTETDVS